MRIYFSGIGGVGIGPLAEIALDAGYQVVGSDPNVSRITKDLEQRGVKVYYSQDGQSLLEEHQLEPIDWFCHTSALPRDHPELVLARQLGIKISKRDQLLAEIIKDHNLKLLAVAGTHGKTTTTGMLIWAFKQLGIPASYAIGTTISFGPSGFFDPNSQYFIYECDEFDKNFLHFSPYLSLITTIDYDHPDTYPTKQEYFDSFGEFIDGSTRTIGWRADLSKCQIDESRVVILDDEMELVTNLPGRHNRQNAELALGAIELLGIASRDDAVDTINQFPGTDRRLEKLADGIYTDYGHHPNEIKATLQMAKEISPKVALIYQPHQNVRQHEILELYTDEVFADCDQLYWLPTYLSREDTSLAVLTPQQLTKNLRKEVYFAELDDALWQKTQELVRNNYLVLFMGAGTIDSWLRKKISA